MLRRQFLHFCIAGTLGFAVDAALVQALVSGGVAGPYLARVFSVAAAILTTFAYNRHITFADRRGRAPAEFGRYLLGNAAGLLVNYGAYAAIVAASSTARTWPVLAVAVGAASGMLVNFLAARHFVFVAR